MDVAALADVVVVADAAVNVDDEDAVVMADVAVMVDACDDDACDTYVFVAGPLPSLCSYSKQKKNYPQKQTGIKEG